MVSPDWRRTLDRLIRLDLLALASRLVVVDPDQWIHCGVLRGGGDFVGLLLFWHDQFCLPNDPVAIAGAIVAFEEKFAQRRACCLSISADHRGGTGLDAFGQRTSVRCRPG